jgi:hypothetical protein
MKSPQYKWEQQFDSNNTHSYHKNQKLAGKKDTTLRGIPKIKVGQYSSHICRTKLKADKIKVKN